MLRLFPTYVLIATRIAYLGSIATHRSSLATHGRTLAFQWCSLFFVVRAERFLLDVRELRAGQKTLAGLQGEAKVANKRDNVGDLAVRDHNFGACFE
eukprot:332719-Amphidinium_carterae.1